MKGDLYIIIYQERTNECSAIVIKNEDADFKDD